MAAKTSKPSKDSMSYLNSRESIELYLCYKDLIERKFKSRDICSSCLKSHFLDLLKCVPHVTKKKIRELKTHIQNETVLVQVVNQALCTYLDEIEMEQKLLR